MTIEEEILNWSANRPDWQRNALRRLVITGELDDADLDDLEALCHSPYQPSVEGDAVGEALPLSIGDLKPAEAAAEPVSLLSLAGVTGVNALAADQTLTFEAQGLTVIYGHNGAGKSGYARVLRKMCRARHQGDALLPDVYGNCGDEAVAADVTYRVGDADHTHQWSPHVEGAAQLRQISFFDADCAAVHVDKQNALAFTPAGLEILPKLVEACKEVADRIASKRKEAEGRKPRSLDPLPTEVVGTAVGEALSTLTRDEDFEPLVELATLSEDEKSRVEELAQLLKSNPEEEAKKLTADRSRLLRFKQSTDAAEKLSSVKAVERLRELHETAGTTQEAAKAARDTVVSDQPLSGVGAATWKAMWDAARTYSQVEAYSEGPDSPFPEIGPDARCVLCQQELDDAARRRLQDFDGFMQDATEAAAKAAAEALAAAVKKIDEGVELGPVFETYAADIAMLDPADVVSIESFGSDLVSYGESVAKIEVGAPFPIAVVSVAAISEILKGRITCLDAKISELEEIADPEKRLLLEKEQAELASRQWLAKHLGDVRDEVGRLAEIHRLDQAKSDTSTQAISRFSGELTDRHASDRLCSQMGEELRRMGADRVRVELKATRAAAGLKQFQMQLKGAEGTPVIRSVLSEGEARCIALAGFFAELATEESGAAIVFDDPVSSLDHTWRRLVAKRLAEASAERQVVIFTHDLVFLHELMNAPVAGLVCRVQCVRSGAQGAGICLDEMPWPTLKLQKRLVFVRSELESAKKRCQADDQSGYERHARDIYGLLREAWESAVEEVLLCGAVQRFRESVQTLRFENLTDIQQADLDAINAGMSKCSRFMRGHSDPDARPDPVPEPNEILSDIDALQGWAKKMKPRRN